VNLNQNPNEKMSLLPFYNEMNDPLYNRWHNFGLGIHPNELELFSHPRSLLTHHTGHRWHQSLDHLRSANQINRSIIGKDGFQVCLDVQLFAPNEVTVKTINKNTIIVDAQHEERQDDHGYISRQFSRRYTLPDDFNIKDVISQLSSDGILTIKAPPPSKSLEDGFRVLQIQQTGPARLTVGNKEEVGKVSE